MVETQMVTVVDSESLLDWLRASLPQFKSIHLMNLAWEAKGESRFFCEINVERTIPLSELRPAQQNSDVVHFFASDAVECAVTEGVLVGEHFYLYHKW